MTQLYNVPVIHTATFPATLTENLSHSSQSCRDIFNAADRRPQTADRRPQTFLSYYLSCLIAIVATMIAFAFEPQTAIAQTCGYNGSDRAPGSPCSLLCPQGLLYNLGTPRGATCGFSLGDGLRLHAYQDNLGYQPMPTIRFSYDKNEVDDCTAERAGRIGIMPPRIPVTLPNIAPFLFPVSLHPTPTIPPTVPPIENFGEGDVFLVSTCGAKNLILSTNNPESRIKFMTTTALGTQNERMTILNNGKVGIGTFAPSFPLHVVNQITAGTAVIGGSYVPSERGIFTLLPGHNENNWYHIDTRDNCLNFSAGGLAGGSIGPIGCQDMVSMNQYGSQVRIGCTFATGWTPAIGGKLTISEDPTTNTGYRSPIMMRIERRNDATYAATHPYTLISAGDNNAETFVVTSNGKVNIGSTTYTNTTYPDYLLSVSGRIVCSEVLVLPTSNWSDFVFDEKYQLPTLTEVENYIQDNKHLPDIPSAQEIKDNGINIGDIQAKLLQKIEELTLYVIEMKKENTEIKKTNIDLQSQLLLIKQQLPEIPR